MQRQYICFHSTHRVPSVIYLDLITASCCRPRSLSHLGLVKNIQRVLFSLYSEISFKQGRLIQHICFLFCILAAEDLFNNLPPSQPPPPPPPLRHSFTDFPSSSASSSLNTSNSSSSSVITRLHRPSSGHEHLLLTPGEQLNLSLVYSERQ